MFWCDFVAGWIGGCAGLTVGHPFDTIKVRQQTMNDISFAHCAKDCLTREGVRGFFKGMSYPLWTAGAMNSVFFGFYGVTLRQIAADSNKPSFSDVFWAGCVGGFAQLSLSCPVELIKIKLQIQDESSHIYRGPFDVMKTIYKAHGIRGCYRGFIAQAVRDCPSFGFYVIIYETVLEWLGSKSHSNLFLAGGTAGVISWLSVIHVDVVKSRIQADDANNPRYTSTWNAFKKCYMEGGLRTFGRGSLAVALRAFPLNGATFLAYEYVLSSCQRDSLL